MTAWVYIVTNRKDGILYVGTTSSLPHRIMQHRSGDTPGFTQKYALKRLVNVEAHATMPLAIEREKRIKKWNCAWKIRLINKDNPEWVDLFERFLT